MTKKPTTKLPIVSAKPTPAQQQRGLAVKPVAVGSKPEFPTRSELYRKASLLGGAALLAGSMAAAAPGCGSAPPPEPAAPTNTAPAEPVATAPATPPPAPIEEAKQPPPAEPPAPPPPPQVDPALLVNGSVDGQPLAETTPTFQVTRGGGGIGPPEEMWDPTEVDAYLSWQMAHEGKLAIKSNVKLSYDGVDLVLAGFDADKNIGYIYFDKMTNTSDQYPKDTLKKIEAWHKQKKLAILVIDQKRNPDTASLKGKVVKFLASTKRSPPAPGPLDGLVVSSTN
ncbi:MAG TPA: hypothetical protein VGG74_23365 [Kofleriaceae bacterium]|jgi:hypothetical protein